MKRRKYTDQEKEELLKSKAILKVENSNVTYSPEYKKGKFPSQIFTEAGINLDILGVKNAKRSLQRWRKIEIQEEGLQGKRKGRPKILSPEEEIQQLKDRNAYLEAENDFLKKLDALERGLM